MVDKNKLRDIFSKEWEKHYRIDAITERGFRRRQCKKCKRYFWSIGETDYCGDTACVGYRFIENPPVKKRLTYQETWEKVKGYFTKNGHDYVAPYPTVARWRDDVYFTIASISNFQPYVVNGEIEPPGNPLIVPQPCLRFVDVSNVGITGRHYTNFIMLGQHAFNTEKTGLFYWKNEAIEHDIRYLKEIGIDEDKITFKEDVWTGGGNFGPSMEYFVSGLELGNCVFMQYAETEDGYKELKTKVIDMGAGLSRLAWITSGEYMSYDTVFGDVIKYLKKENPISIDNEIIKKYSKLAGYLNEEDIEDVEAEKENIARTLGMSKEELFKTIEPVTAIYSIADHLMTILYTTTDGMLPSNSGGGYNLRVILRRVFDFEDMYDIRYDTGKIIELHAKRMKSIVPRLMDGIQSTVEVIEEERKKYKEAKAKAYSKIIRILKKKRHLTKQDIRLLYESHGITPTMIEKTAKENNIKIEMPGGMKHILIEDASKKKVEITKRKEIRYKKTIPLYYTREKRFKAKIIGIEKDVKNKGKDIGYLILNATGFYPESGGQVADTGTINSMKVLDVKKIDGVVFHKIHGISRFKVGEEVVGEVDIERRKQISRNHTAAHILNAACREVLGKHVWQAGAYKEYDKASLDITHYRRITDKEIKEIERKVNEFILRAVPIEIEVLDRGKAEKVYGFRIYQGGAVPGKEIRIVKIEGIDAEACGGTHGMLNTTADIGMLKIIKRESVKDGVERIVYTTGEPAIAYIQKEGDIVKEACEEVKVPKADLPKTVKRFFSEWKKQKDIINKLIEIYVKDRMSSKEDKIFFIKLPGGKEIVQNACKVGIGQEKGAIICISNDGFIGCSTGRSSNYNADDVLKKIIALVGGNCGGSKRMASGKIEIKGNEKEIIEKIEDILHEI